MVSVRLAITDLVVVVLATTNGVVDCSSPLIVNLQLFLVSFTTYVGASFF